MISKLLIAWALMAACVVIHASGVTWALRWARERGGSRAAFVERMWLFVRIAAGIILFHLIEILVWGGAYWWTGAIPDPQSAVYFSAVTYTTTGYGDVVLPVEWRLVGGVEALTGILMCGWSTAFFFAVVSRLELQTDTPRN